MTAFAKTGSLVKLAGMGDTAVIRLRDGAELWTAVSGTGPPVVLLHGGPGLWDYLAPLAALLDGEFTVVRFDQRGCGRSTGRGGPFTIAQAVDDMDRVRAALGFSRWAVVGHSWGAELALRYAARHPDLVTAVAYVGGVGAGNGFRDACKAELGRRLGPDRERWTALSAIPDADPTPAGPCSATLATLPGPSGPQIPAACSSAPCGPRLPPDSGTPRSPPAKTDLAQRKRPAWTRFVETNRRFDRSGPDSVRQAALKLSH